MLNDYQTNYSQTKNPSSSSSSNCCFSYAGFFVLRNILIRAIRLNIHLKTFFCDLYWSTLDPYLRSDEKSNVNVNYFSICKKVFEQRRDKMVGVLDVVYSKYLWVIKIN